MGSFVAGRSFLNQKPGLFIRNLSCSASVNKPEEIKPFKDIPGPKPLPVIGNLWRYLPIIGEYSFKKMHRTYEKMYSRYGPLIREVIVGKREIVHVFKPDDIMKVYRSEGKFPQRRSHNALAKYRRERPDVYKSVGLFPSNGEEWLRFRRLFQNVLMHPTIAKSYYKVLEEVTDDFVARIPRILNKQNEVDLQPELFKWALECVAAVTLDRRLGCLSLKGNEDVDKLVKAAHDTHYSTFVTETSPFFEYFKTPSYKRLVAAQDHLASVVATYIREAQSRPSEDNENSLLGKMLKVPGADFKDVFTMVLDMFLAGIDTTAYTTAFALYNLTKNPNVQETLRAELLAKLPEKNSEMSSLMDQLPYLSGVVRESLRINPVSFGNGRVLVQDVELSNYKVPAGSLVILQHQACSLKEENFSNPLSFQPNRWVSKEAKKHHQYASAPFGAGTRSCIGRRIALREMSFAVGKLVRNFHIEYHHEDIDAQTRLINVPDRPLMLRFREI